MLKRCQQPQGGFRVPLKLTGSFGMGTLSLESPPGYDLPPSNGERAALTVGTQGYPVRVPEDLGPVVGTVLRPLAIGCLYRLTGFGWAHFPTTSRSSPSRWVYIVPSHLPLLREGDEAIFPISIDWRRWEYAVVPVLEDPRWSFELPINKRRVLQERYAEFVDLLERALIQSFKAAGYLPENFG